DHPGEPAGDDAAAVAEPLERADRGARARGELQLRRHLVEHGLGQAGQHGDAAAQRLGEVQLAPHRRLGDGPDLGLGARVRGEHLDDLALDERRVDVEDDQPLAAPGEPGPLDGDVDARGAGHLDEPRAQGAGRVVLAPPAGPSRASGVGCAGMALVAVACSPGSWRPSGSWWGWTTSPRVSRPRVTTCSTAARSTRCRVSAAKGTELRPGRSGPVTVMRTL